jgi:hypothetical protein
MLAIDSIRGSARRRSRGARPWLHAAQTVEPGEILAHVGADTADLGSRVRRAPPEIPAERPASHDAVPGWKRG